MSSTRFEHNSSEGTGFRVFRAVKPRGWLGLWALLVPADLRNVGVSDKKMKTPKCGTHNVKIRHVAALDVGKERWALVTPGPRSL